jgi:hypothetical protein
MTAVEMDYAMLTPTNVSVKKALAGKTVAKNPAPTTAEAKREDTVTKANVSARTASPVPVATTRPAPTLVPITVDASKASANARLASRASTAPSPCAPTIAQEEGSAAALPVINAPAMKALPALTAARENALITAVIEACAMPTLESADATKGSPEMIAARKPVIMTAMATANASKENATVKTTSKASSVRKDYALITALTAAAALLADVSVIKASMDYLASTMTVLITVTITENATRVSATATPAGTANNAK